MSSVKKLVQRRNRARTSTLHIQVHFSLKLPRGVTVTRKFLNEVFRLWIDTGDTPKHIEVKTINWRNRSAKTPAQIEEARRNLRTVFRSSHLNITYKDSGS